MVEFNPATSIVKFAYYPIKGSLHNFPFQQMLKSSTLISPMPRQIITVANLVQVQITLPYVLKYVICIYLQ